MGAAAIKDSKAYVAGLQDASRAIAERRVTDLESAYQRRDEKCTEGDDYSCGAKAVLESERFKIQMAQLRAAQIEIGAKGCNTAATYQSEGAARWCAGVLESRNAKSSLLFGEFSSLRSHGPLLRKDRYRAVTAFDRCSRPVGFRIERYNPSDFSYMYKPDLPKFLDPSCFPRSTILESLRTYTDWERL